MKVVRAKSVNSTLVTETIKKIYPKADTTKRIYTFYKIKKEKTITQFKRNIEVIGLTLPKNKNQRKYFGKAFKKFITKDKIRFNFGAETLNEYFDLILNSELVSLLYRYQDNAGFRLFLDNLTGLMYDLFVFGNLNTNNREELSSCIESDVKCWLMLNRIVKSPCHTPKYMYSYKLDIFTAAVNHELNIVTEVAPGVSGRYMELVWMCYSLHGKECLMFTCCKGQNFVIDSSFNIYNINNWLTPVKSLDSIKACINWLIINKHDLMVGSSENAKMWSNCGAKIKSVIETIAKLKSDMSELTPEIELYIELKY